MQMQVNIDEEVKLASSVTNLVIKSTAELRDRKQWFPRDNLIKSCATARVQSVTKTNCSTGLL